MARFTKESLIKVREMFDNRELILVNNRIYKKVKRCVNITLENEIISVEEHVLLNKYYNIDKESISERYQKLLICFNDLINNGDYLLEYNGIYKKYGGTHQRGYIRFFITIDNIEYTTFAHRIIYYLYFGIWDELLVINHKDSNKSNNMIENIELISQFDNILYSIQNDEIIMHPCMLDDYTRSKYRLNDEQWKTFKIEVHIAFNRHNKEKRNLEMASQYKKILCAIKDNQICQNPDMLEDIFKNKYNLNNEEWEAFKDEVSNGNEPYHM